MKDLNTKKIIRELDAVLRGAGKKILAMRRAGNFGVERKSRYSDIVTRGDKYAEKVIVAYITKHFPDHGMRGEEGTDTTSTSTTGSSYEWIIDPIDGTTNYSKNNNLFGMSVGLYKNGKGVLGMIYYPALEKMTWAIVGGGAYLNGKRIRFKKAGGKKTNEKLKDALVSASISRGKEDLFKTLRDQSFNLLIGGSFTGESLWLLEGQIDAYISTGATPFDFAAAQIIIKEAGGFASGVASKEIPLHERKTPVILAKSEGLVHELRKILSAQN